MDAMTRSAKSGDLLQLTPAQIEALIGSGGGYPHIVEWISRVGMP